ncbi:MAG TPA: hypothetical protein VMT16_13145, partial [Thermoanaerobaculia bacterium]|nr:hypothetical protein [Thermoanaerobaculia bacterium]
GAGAAAWWERTEPARQERLTRRAVALSAMVAADGGRGRWSWAGSLAAEGARGETGGGGWGSWGGSAGLRLGRGDLDLEMAWAAQGVDDPRHPLDLVRVGGLPSSLLPGPVTAHRVFEPALPAGTLLGERYQGQRASLGLPGVPLRPFWGRHRVESQGLAGEWLQLAGLELRLDLPPLPLLRLPAATLQLGAAEILDPPFEGDTHWWLGLAWRP